MTITEFLLARIAEDEDLVQDAEPGGLATADVGAISEVLMMGQDRLVAECEAKRRIVEREESEMRIQWRRRSDEHRQTWESWLASKGRGEMPTLRDLAAVYGDHPDYDPAWRP